MKRAEIAAAAAIWALAVPASGALGDSLYLGYAGKSWDRDYGVLDGRCNRQAVGAVLGVVARAASAPKPPRVKDRPIATVAGSVLDAAAGAGNGRDMDDVDRACLGHALELSGSERGVAWINAETGTAYMVITLGGFTDRGRACREFVTRVVTGGGSRAVRRRACTVGSGEWQILGVSTVNG